MKNTTMPERIFVPFAGPLQEAQFIERPNRFLVRCELLCNLDEVGCKTKNTIVEAHLADPGRLKELLIPGRRLWLRPVSDSGRKTKWTVMITESPQGDSLVSLDSTLPNRVIRKALVSGAMEELGGWSLAGTEYRIGKSRFDFLLTAKDGRRLALEVKSVTLVQDRTAFFPDAITARGARHVRELMEIAGEKGWGAAVLFVAQRDDVERIKVAPAIDPVFAGELTKARLAGVRVLGRKCRLTLEGIELQEQVSVE